MTPLVDGKQDTACNYVGGYRVATESLTWAGNAAFKQAPLQPLLIGGAETGSYKNVGPLTWVEVEAAGHMVRSFAVFCKHHDPISCRWPAHTNLCSVTRLRRSP